MDTFPYFKMMERVVLVRFLSVGTEGKYLFGWRLMVLSGDNLLLNCDEVHRSFVFAQSRMLFFHLKEQFNVLGKTLIGFLAES